MAATTILDHAVIARVLNWKRYAARLVIAFLLIVDGSFVIAGLAKIPVGGWLPLASVDTTAVYLTASPEDNPYILGRHWLQKQALHRRIVLLTIVATSTPYVEEYKRVKIEQIAKNLVRVRAAFGFMELPMLGRIVESCTVVGLNIDNDDRSSVVAAPRITARKGRHMPGPQRWLFEVLLKLSGTLAKDMGIPSDQLVLLGVDVPV